MGLCPKAWIPAVAGMTTYYCVIAKESAERQMTAGDIVEELNQGCPDLACKSGYVQ